MEDYVEVIFDPPRKFSQVGASYFFPARVGEPKLHLPVGETDLSATESAPDGPVAMAVKIPRWLAEDRGLVEKAPPVGVSEMSRHDWFLLGAVIAMAIQHKLVLTPTQIVWEARKLAELMEAE